MVDVGDSIKGSHVHRFSEERAQGGGDSVLAVPVLGPYGRSATVT